MCPNTSPLLVLARVERLDLLGEHSQIVLTRAVLDEVRDQLDAAARREARRLGISVTGTLGLILRAKTEGRLEQAAPLLERAVAAGLYLDDAVLSSALASVGERWRR